MVFTSLSFLLFFPAVIIIYYLLPKGLRWGFLLAASLYFYVNIQPIYAILLLLNSVLTYTFALQIEKQKNENAKEILLRIGVVLILLPLFFFKYYNFVNESIFSALDLLGIRWHLPQITWLLPIGISFYTFMAIGYVVDVYNEEIEAEKNVGLVTLFLSFFPLVLSGPIERATSMFPQFKNKLDFNYQMAVNGFQLMLWGYFMKLVVANRIDIYVSPIFDQVDLHSGSTILLATLLYPVQVYGDLGGYSLIAIGAASVMGIHVRPNFQRPFFATTMSEFWRRWHISLISWITDYLYTPISLTYRNYGVWGVVLALMVTFLIAGVWHGASLTFIVWGIIQGVVVSMEALTKKHKSKFEKRYALGNKFWYITLGILTTYLLFAFSLIFGGAVDSIPEALLAIKKIFSGSGPLFLDKAVLLYAMIGMTILFLSDFRDEFFPKKILLFQNENVIVRWSSYFAVLLVIFVFGVFEGDNFIYFNF